MVKQNNIPQEMKDIPNWICWKKEWLPKDERWTKVLYNAKTGSLAKSNDSSTWTSFNNAFEVFGGGGYTGVGFVFTEEAGIVGLDLDHLEKSPEREAVAKDLIKKFDTYTEISPSGSGYHLYFKAKKKFKKGKGLRSEPIFGEEIETYSKTRFFTVTGNIYGDKKTVENRQEYYDWLGKKYFTKKEVEQKSIAPTEIIHFEDQEIINKITRAKNSKKFLDLYNNRNLSDYPEYFRDGKLDLSSVDMALAGILAFWSSDREQIRRIMMTSKLVREKWNRPDYLYRPIDEVLSSPGEKYTPPIEIGPAPRLVEQEDFKTIEFNDLPDTWDDEEWIVKDLFCKGGLFNFSAYNKTGKTAFLTCFYKALADNDEQFVGKDIKKTKILHISEEYERSWIKKKRDFGKADVTLAMNPFPKSKSVDEWRQRLDIVLKKCKKEGFEMVVFDTIDQFWGVNEENDAVDTSTNIEALRILTKEGICVVSVLHTRKNGGVVGKDTRGSGAINDKVDGLISFSRVDEEDITNNKRILSVGNGRFYDEPYVWVVEFDTTTKKYSFVANNTFEAKEKEEEKKLMDFIPVQEAEAMSSSQIYKEMKESDIAHYGHTKIKRILSNLLNKDIVCRKPVGKTTKFWRKFL